MVGHPIIVYQLIFQMVKKSKNVLSSILETLWKAEQEGDDFLKAKSFFDLVASLWWPRAPKAATLMSRLMMARYVSGLRAQPDRVPPADMIPVLTRYADIDSLISDCLNEDAYMLAQDMQNDDLPRLTALIVRFIVVFAEEDVKGGPSISKAFYLLERGKLWGEEPCAWRRFSQTWAKYKDVSPLLLVERYSQKRFMKDLNPAARGFQDAAAAILADPSHIPQFLGHSKWVTARLRGSLDLRALREMDLPSFPEAIVERPFSLAKPEKAIVRLLKNYTTPAR